MEALIRKWDGETVIVHYDRPTGAWIFIAIHSTRLGPAAGGTRMKPYHDIKAALQDALRLSEGMTYKFAIPGMPFGGGKAVIAIPSDFTRQSCPALLRRHGALIQQLGGLSLLGPMSAPLRRIWTLSPKPALPMSSPARWPPVEAGHPDLSQHWGYSPACRPSANNSSVMCL